MQNKVHEQTARVPSQPLPTPSASTNAYKGGAASTAAYSHPRKTKYAHWRGITATTTMYTPAVVGTAMYASTVDAPMTLLHSSHTQGRVG